MRGVRQGDPVSPLMFNLVIDKLLDELPDFIGIKIGKIMMNALAFADDLILMAETVTGLQTLISQAEEFLASSGLRINPGKSFTLSMVPSGKTKQIRVTRHRFFLDNGYELRTLGVEDKFEYLGIQFSALGVGKLEIAGPLKELLQQVTSAPLKPQQRLFLLRTFVLPRFLHRLTLCQVRAGHVRRLDVIIRREIRRWLRLPDDTPTGYFHAGVSDGGLGVMSLRTAVPRIRLSRMMAFEGYCGVGGVETFESLRREISQLNRMVLLDGLSLVTKSREEAFWKKRLYASIDGSALRPSRKVEGQHRWVSDGSNFLSGKDFINIVKTRINALPVLSRASRGRSARSRGCSAGCSAVESLNHVTQHCYRTHRARIMRHNAVVAYLVRGLEQRGFIATREPRFSLGSVTLVPDIVACREEGAFVIDPQVVSAGLALDDADRIKVAKYNGPDLIQAVKNTYSVREVTVLAATLNNRGVWSPRSARELLAFKIISKSDLKIISTRVALGTYVGWTTFQSMTTRGPGPRWPRVGVG